MKLFTILLALFVAVPMASFAQVINQLPVGASNCAIAEALGLKQPDACINPPLGQTRGIVIRLNGQLDQKQTITPAVSRTTKPLPVLKKPVPIAKTDRSAAKSENGYFIHFAFNSFDLETEFKEHIERLSVVLTSSAMEKTCLRVAGHTDTIGSEKYNKELSKKRAIMVATYLAEVSKIDPKRIQIAAIGEDRPLPDIKGTDPRNRRVEFMTRQTQSGCET